MTPTIRYTFAREVAESIHRAKRDELTSASAVIRDDAERHITYWTKRLLRGGWVLTNDDLPDFAPGYELAPVEESEYVEIDRRLDK